MKLTLIRLLDWIDHHILDHRWYWVCMLVATSEWWGDELSPEEKSQEAKAEYAQDYAYGMRDD